MNFPQSSILYRKKVFIYWESSNDAVSVRLVKFLSLCGSAVGHLQHTIDMLCAFLYNEKNREVD
ncbi:hypothetical protein SELSPUOL_00978 [Selenomonas sputigena ATCC 35185]|uniref:Uncharacterized protein n=1 Tax=Selenomonas sputigena (strain ATCC 35185 / DSM 20758 / CCUG 44933 / VPI D19B-28) TaxID=546271 RepID=C9LUH0_SELS3|nr:hypothetical protein SELSPUOL_00978 [Selenomonas sputigena ATCC 35185]